MALTDLIEEELIATLESGGDPKAVIDRYSGSKGPLYIALARALHVAQGRFPKAQQELSTARQKRKALMDTIKETQAEARSLEKTVRQLEEQKESLEAQVSKQKHLLAEARALQSQGFDTERLSKLGAILGRIGKIEGVSVDAVAERLLAFAQDHERLARAAAEADAAEAKAKEALAKAKVDQAALEIARWWASQKIPAKTVLAERKIAMKLKLPLDGLAERLSEVLDQYGTLEAACRERERKREDLSSEIARMKAENAALEKEQRRMQSAIEAVSKTGSARIAKTEKQAASAIKNTCSEYLDAINKAGGRMTDVIKNFSTLQKEAAALEKHLNLARALSSTDPEPWKSVTPDSWGTVLWQLGHWVEATGNNPEVRVPDVFRRGLEDQAKFPSLYGVVRLPLLDLVAWTAVGMRSVPEEAVKVAAQAHPDG